MASTRSNLQSRHEPAISVPASLMESMLGLMASGAYSPESVTSAAIPCSRSAPTMLAAQKFRVDYYRMGRKLVGPIARLVTERNWFAREVHKRNMAFYGSGFRLRGGEEMMNWSAGYPFARIHNDALYEYLVSNCVVAFWRKDAPKNSIPWVEIPDAENVEYDVTGGIETIKVSMPLVSKKKLDEKKLGNRMYEALAKKGYLEISTDDKDFDFAVMKEGKSGAGLPMPSLTGVLDDLDFIELVRVGDWNGAYARREILRVTKKGAGVSSGPNAGTTRLNAKARDLKAIAAYMKKIAGKADLAVNWDQDTAWLVFGREFFGGDILDAALKRLIFWGGIGAISLLRTDSQMAGMSSLLYDALRAVVLKFRADFSAFLSGIFNSGTFLNGLKPPEPIRPVWNVKPLYTTDGFARTVASASERAWLDPQTIREEWWGVSDEAVSTAVRDAHSRREDYTPVFEPRQGIVSGLFPDPNNPPASQSYGQEGDPGRPSVPIA